MHDINDGFIFSRVALVVELMLLPSRNLLGVLALSSAVFEGACGHYSVSSCGQSSYEISEMGSRRKSSIHNFKKRKALRKDIGYVEERSNLCVMSLNVNGLTISSVHDIEAAINSKKVDLVTVTETKFRLEENHDHHMIPGFKTFETRRSDVAEDKGGGGIIVYYREGLSVSRYSPSISSQMSAFVNNERIWTVVEGNKYKTAVCTVYCACQYDDDRNSNWNQLLYARIREEQAELRGKGYRILLIGDFNGHIGCDDRIGIPGNKPGINPNGNLLLEFERYTDMSILNRRSSGLWTWKRGGHTTVLDYALLSSEHIDSFESMYIDDTNFYGGDSDHNVLFVVLSEHFVVPKLFSQFKIDKPTWDIRADQDWSSYTNAVLKHMNKINLSSIQSLSHSITNVIHQSMREGVGVKSSVKRSKPRALPPDIVRALAYRKQLGHEYMILLNQYQRDKKSVPGTLPSQLLKDAEQLLENQKNLVSGLLSDFNLSKRKLNIEKCKGNSPAARKHFWSFVSNKVKKSSDISAVRNEASGVIKCNPDDILEEATLFLKKLFQGDFNPIPKDNQATTSDHNYHHVPPEFPPPPIPGASHSTSDHDYGARVPPKLSSYDNSKSSKNDPTGFLDEVFSLHEIREAVSSLKMCKARGIDDIPNECFKFAPPVLIDKLLVLYNMIGDQKLLPPKFNHGKVVLIHKKGPAEMLSNYRPLTVSISMYSIYSRMLNSRLTKVVEDHDLLGEIQSGFRKSRSASDNLFVLNTILSRAKEMGQQVHKSFIDIVKAYDTVNRPLLWRKMRKMGFSDSFIENIKTLYDDVCITSTINGRTTRPVYLSRGVKQGCSLSPMLFALYLADLGYELSNCGEGFDLQGVKISALFFADDIVLFSPTAKGLKNLIKIVHKHCDLMKLSISESKSKVMSSSITDFTFLDDFGEEVLTLDKVALYKYLGLDMYGSVWKTNIEKQRKAVLKARQFKGACLSIANRGPDVSSLASCMWLNMAIPSILYACESIPFSDSNILCINRVQSQLAKALLGVPISAHNFVAQTEMGFRDFAHSLWSQQLKAFTRWRDLPDSRWAKLAMLEHLTSTEWHSKYFEYIVKVKNTISLPYVYSEQMIELHLSDYFLKKLNSEIVKANLPSYKPVSVISKNTFVNESELSAMLTGIKVNYCKNNQTQGTGRNRVCPFCPGVVGRIGPPASEFHVTWVCPKVENVRKMSGITWFKNQVSMNLVNDDDSFYMYVNGLDVSNNKVSQAVIDDRIRSLSSVRSAWLKLV